MDVIETKIPEVKKLIPRRFGDNRGFFSEVWNSKRLTEAGIETEFVQDNHSFSAEKGTIRGLHFQAPPFAQGKLVRVARGAVLDVAVDIRKSSPTYGQWVAEELSYDNGAQLWVPRGFLHAFLTLTTDVDLIYKIDNWYSPEADGAVRFDDPDLAIDWGINPKDAVLSDKDARAPLFADFQTPFE